MNIIVFDEARQRKSQITEALEKSRFNVVACTSTGQFMSAVDETHPDMVLVDADTWNLGKSIYNYFEVGRKLEKTPIIFYNTTDTAPTVAHRSRNEKDKSLLKPTEIPAVVEAVEQSA